MTEKNPEMLAQNTLNRSHCFGSLLYGMGCPIAIAILNSVQLEVLKAKASKKRPTILTVAWAVEAVAYLGGPERTSS